MNHRTLTLIFLIVLATVALNGCTVAPDLMPTTSAGRTDDPTGFCKSVENSTKVVVKVKNQTLVDAAASTTTVEFSTGGSFQFPTPAIPANSSVELPPINIPSGCFSPDCLFKITVNSPKQINETIETNNSLNGTCIG